MNFVPTCLFTGVLEGANGGAMDETNDDGKIASALKTRSDLVRYLQAAIPSVRAINPTVEFFLQLAMKQLAEGESRLQNGDRKSRPEGGS
jgi:hypothetical protein